MATKIVSTTILSVLLLSLPTQATEREDVEAQVKEINYPAYQRFRACRDIGRPLTGVLNGRRWVAQCNQDGIMVSQTFVREAPANLAPQASVSRQVARPNTEPSRLLPRVARRVESRGRQQVPSTPRAGQPFQSGARNPRSQSRQDHAAGFAWLRGRGNRPQAFTGGGAQAQAGGSRCPSVPRSAQEAYIEAVTFRSAYRRQMPNGEEILSRNFIAINDYSAPQGKSMQYIFDARGVCILSTPVAAGYGRNGQKALAPAKRVALPCADGSEYSTPPGFHVTDLHTGGAKYNASNSCLLRGLQGQSSAGRGILIHPVSSSWAGNASTQGCPAVDANVFTEVKETLGVGSLVYNYFGDKTAAPKCNSQAGMRSARPVMTSPDGAGGLAQLARQQIARTYEATKSWLGRMVD